MTAQSLCELLNPADPAHMPQGLNVSERLSVGCSWRVSAELHGWNYRREGGADEEIWGAG